MSNVRQITNMTRFQLRILFLLPVVLGVVAALGIFGAHPQWPEPAQAYLAWFLQEPLTPMAFLLNRASAVGLLGVLISTVGLLFFWGPSRYTYLVSLLLSFLGAVPDVPVLVGGWDYLIDGVVQTLLGINVALIFSGSGRQYFFATRKSA